MTNSKIRSCNVKNLDQYRRSFSNALFNIHFKSFDDIFSLIDISSRPELFVEERIDGTVTSTEYFKRFTMSPQIKTYAELAKFMEQERDIHTLGSLTFLYGKKGVGKSSLLKHFFKSQLDDPLALSLFLDLFGLQVHESVENTVWGKIHFHSKRIEDTAKYFDDVEFAKEVRPLFKNLSSEEIARYLLNDRKEYLQDFMNFISQKRRVYIVFDNTDDLGISIVKNLVKIGYSLARDYPVKVIFSLRDYWRSPKIGLGKEFQHSTIYLHPPKIQEVIKKRIANLTFDKKLPFEIEYTKHTDQNEREKVSKPVTVEDIKTFLFTFSEESMNVDLAIADALFKMCNYNVREVLDNMYGFFHSCNLPLAPIFQRVILKKEHKTRSIRLSDFITCFFTIHSVCFDYKSCKLFNIFDMSCGGEADNYRNTLGFVRILQRCSIGESILKDSLVGDFQNMGYSHDILEDALNVLLDNGLIESPDGIIPVLVETLNLTEKGNFYLNELIYMFDYLLYIQDRVPMHSKYHRSVESRFGNPHTHVVGRGNWLKRKESVLTFLDFLASEEKTESLEFKRQPQLLTRIRGGYEEPISDKILTYIKKEITDIEKRYHLETKKDDIEILNIKPRFPKDELSRDHNTNPRTYHDDEIKGI